MITPEEKKHAQEICNIVGPMVQQAVAAGIQQADHLLRQAVARGISDVAPELHKVIVTAMREVRNDDVIISSDVTFANPTITPPSAANGGKGFDMFAWATGESVLVHRDAVSRALGRGIVPTMTPGEPYYAPKPVDIDSVRESRNLAHGPDAWQRKHIVRGALQAYQPTRHPIKGFETDEEMIAWLDSLYATEGSAVTNRKSPAAQAAIAGIRAASASQYTPEPDSVADVWSRKEMWRTAYAAALNGLQNIPDVNHARMAAEQADLAVKQFNTRFPEISK